MDKLHLNIPTSLSSPDSAVGIDIGTSSIKLVELKKKGGKAILETYSTLALGPYAKLDVGATTNLPTADLTKALADALKEGAIATKDAAISIPSSASLVFLLELPSAIGEKELADIVPTEARKYIPVPVSEVSLDYWVIPHQEEGFYEEDGSESKIPAKSEVLTAAIHNDTLAKYRELASNSGLNANIFEIEVFSAIRSTFAHELSAVLLIDFGASKTKLAIVEYGIVRSFHIVNRGSFDITSNISKSLSIPFEQAEDRKRDIGLLGTGNDKQVSDIAKIAVDYIFSESASAISNFERKYNKPISKIILTGAGSMLKGFHEQAQETFRVETIKGNPFDKVEVPAFITKVLAETGPEFAVALGLALRKLG
ncbi:MAG: type IV pilus assembly protein PilM [Candidatus Pacebacteria bacterium]|nr:type IV pilus assembly protein PilM [Candidatus Paceibacterota bacterium]